MLTIRLQRAGKKNHAQFRVVLAEKESHVSKKVAEILGSYNPHKKGLIINNPERINYWISQNVDMSPTVHNIFVTNGLIKGDKVKSFNIPKKTEEPKEEAAPQSETPAAEAAPEAQPVAEAPAEEAPKEEVTA